MDGTLIQNVNISNNPNLQYLHLDDTLIESVDFSNNSSIYSFKASNCSNLEYVNARNNQNFFISQFIAENNPNLDYICIDDISYATINFDFPNNTILTEDCVNPNGDYNIIRGRLSYDFNGDGCAPDDVPVPNKMIYSTNGTDQYASFANQDGEYALVVGTGAYTTNVIEYNDLFDTSPNSSTQEFTDYGNTSFQNYCFTANQDISNVWTYMCVLQDSRPGYETSYIINVPNSGTILSSGTIEFEFDGDKQSFVSASEVPISQTGNSLVFSYADLIPLQKKQILIHMMTFAPPIVNGDDVLNFTLTAMPDVLDQFPDNNTCVRSQVVVNSYDPNDKLVAQGAEISIEDIDEYLIYTIRFQNTGTASALNVKIIDLLSEDLDWNTLTPVDSSHNYSVQLTNGNNLEILFEDINLPAQQDNEIDSNGHFIFKIKPKSNLVVGDVITGAADIYFDFNAPITTDMVSTEIIENQLSVSELELKGFLIYPNPVNNTLTIEGKSALESIAVYDVNGRELNAIDIENNQLQYLLDVSALSQGIYFIEVQSGSYKSSKKFIKE